MINSGIININKPAGMTSHDVVSRVRRAVGIKRVGHTGTLDPMATGVLPVCVGTAARITEYLDMDFKTYKCSLVLGKITDTQDIWGEVLEERRVGEVSEKSIREALGRFSGMIEQKPPMYSAVRVGGKRLYEYARAGQAVDVKTRKVYIKNLNIDDIDMRKKTVTFTVECSKGTYIRTICQDAGLILGCGAAMISLERTSSGRFDIKDSTELSALEGMKPEEIFGIMKDADFPLVHFGRASVGKQTAMKFINGQHLPLNLCSVERLPEYRDRLPEIDVRPEYRNGYNVYYRAEKEDIFLGVAFYSDRYKKLVADKVLIRGDDIENI